MKLVNHVKTVSKVNFINWENCEHARSLLTSYYVPRLALARSHAPVPPTDPCFHAARGGQHAPQPSAERVPHIALQTPYM